MRLPCDSINVRERPWASKRQPIDYKRCCTDRLNPHPGSGHPAAAHAYEHITLPHIQGLEPCCCVRFRTHPSPPAALFFQHWKALATGLPLFAGTTDDRPSTDGACLEVDHRFDHGHSCRRNFHPTRSRGIAAPRHWCGLHAVRAEPYWPSIPRLPAERLVHILTDGEASRSAAATPP